MEYGLIGEHLPHSFSKIIHEKLAPYQYDMLELAPDEVDAFMRKKDFKGINVTIPYKEKVIPYLDEISDRARRIGAVNTPRRPRSALRRAGVRSASASGWSGSWKARGAVRGSRRARSSRG